LTDRGARTPTAATRLDPTSSTPAPLAPLPLFAAFRRLALERRVLARLVAAHDARRVQRYVRGLTLSGVASGLVGEHGHVFGAIRALAARGEAVDVDAIVREARGCVDADCLAWIASAYADGESLLVLAERLLDANRRALADSIACTLMDAARDQAGDVERAITIAVGALRRLGRAA
jgi:hypothetical protein